MVIEREAGEAGGRGPGDEVKRERARGGGGGRGQKGEKRGRVRAVATSGGTNGTLVSGGRKEDRTGCMPEGGNPGAAAAAAAVEGGWVAVGWRWLTVGTRWR